MTAIALALLSPLVVVALVVLLLSQAGPHEIVLAGVPRDILHGLESAPQGEASISAEKAIALARDRVHTPNASIRQVALGRYSNDAGNESLRGRLVWLINFGNPDEVSRGGGSCAIDSPVCTCYWAYHASYVYVGIDATTGEDLFRAEGGGLDASRAPQPDWPDVTAEERGRCERVLREAARSP